MFFNLNEKSQKESKKIKELCNKYKEYITFKNDGNKASSKNFYVIIKQEKKENQKEDEKEINRNIAINILNEKYFKIKEALSRCGNIVYDVNKKEDIVSILGSFFATNKTNEGE